MKILPVLDLMNGQVVHGIAGKRESYQPIQSSLCDGANPVTIAATFREQFGLTEFYVADLDAILDQRPNLSLYTKLLANDDALWLDSGVNSLETVQPLLESGVHRVIIGLETCPGAVFLRQLVGTCDPQRIVFSLDLKHDEPMGNCEGWQNPTPWGIAAEVISLGVSQLIVLELASVGSDRGVTTLSLCENLLREYPHLELTTGGGVRSVDDIRLLEKSNIAGVLVASALHNGSLTPGDLQPWLKTEL